MSRGSFTAIKTEGGLVPREILERVAAEDADLPGIDQTSYHLPPNERLGEAINRSWNRLLGLWEAYSDALAARGEHDAATGLTRDRWLLPLFDELGYGRLQRSTAVEIEGKSFAISHAWYRTPIHLVGAGVSIDRRSPGVAGAAAAAPHSLVQEFLNRSGEHLWALVSNGKLLRILRDNHSLSRQAYVEFDLEAIMEGELFSDFRVLWLVCHQSRVEAEEPEESLLEAWFQLSREEGVRALDALRDGVERAIEAFGAGFLRHPTNGRLHEGLRSGELDRQDYYRELLRLIYRLIFLFVAEDRDALLDPDAPADARQRYTRYYASNQLRELAGRRRGTAHDDLWKGLRLVLSKLNEGSPELGLPGLGSFLWSPEAVEWIGDAELRNDDLLGALRALCYTSQDHQLLPVNWRTLGSEELGSVYESLLELHPQMNREAGIFELETAAGHERKTTGSYYTPTSLVDRLIESALEPVLEEAMRAEDPEAALLDLKVCDTAAGSGHFLVAAARRIALRLASVRTGDEEASPEAVTHALRDVVGRCIYGVDLNPLAVELCKVSLWMEALEPGKPLSFLDHHIQLGNSLLGTTPALMREGIPTDAFKEIEGDDRKYMLELRKRNREEQKSEQIGFHTQMVAEAGARYAALEDELDELNRTDDSTLEAVQRKEDRYRRLLDGPRYRAERMAADAWCAAFVWRKTENAPPAITEDVFRQIERQPDEVLAPVAMEVRRLADRYRFFHFHLAFPDVFKPAKAAPTEDGVTGWPGGFDVVLGNPPWERIKLQEKEWFAERSPEIAEAPNAAKRRKLIAALEEDDPELFEAFTDAKREADGETHFIRNAARYPLCGRGDVNTYSVFAELARQVIGDRGRCGLVIPSGIATDHTTKEFFSDLVETHSISSLYEFENVGFFKGAGHGHMLRFALLSLVGQETRITEADFMFQGQAIEEIDDPERHFTLTPSDIRLLNPNTKTCPIFTNSRDKDITTEIYRRVPVLVLDDDLDGNVWGVDLLAMFHMSGASSKFATKRELAGDGWSLVGNHFVKGGKRYVPLYEAKMMQQYNHRHGDFADGEDGKRAHRLPSVPMQRLQNPAYAVEPFYWVSEEDFRARLDERWSEDWLLGWRDVTDARASARTVIATALPRAATSDKLPVMLPSRGNPHELLSNLLSLPFDYVARQKIGGTALKFFTMKQLPVLPPATYLADCPWDQSQSLSDWIRSRVLELSFTAWDLAGFAKRLNWEGPPFRWEAKRRFLLKREIDAAFAHLYGISREDLHHILDHFSVLKRREKRSVGEFRTKEVIVEIYDEMAGVSRTGEPYQTRLDPPPADPSLAHTAQAEEVPT